MKAGGRFRRPEIVIVAAAFALLGGRSVPPLTGAAPVARYHDVAGRSATGYTTRNDFRETKYFIQPMCGGVVIFDYDHDGIPDLYFTNGAELPSLRKGPGFEHCLLHGSGKALYEDRTAAAGLRGIEAGYSIGATAGDYDNDGFPDLFLCNVGANILYHNNGDGTFSNVTGGSGIVKPPGTVSIGAAWFDYDNDGLLDLVVADYTMWTPASDVRCIDPSVGQKYCSPTRYPSVPSRLYRNLGGGKFADVTETAGLAKAMGKGMGISIADVNQDGAQDVLIVNDTERNFLFLNNGNGSFAERGFLYGVAFNEDGSAVSGMGSDAKDFDNDGFVDLFYNDLSTQIFGFFFNDQGRGFRYASPAIGLARLSHRYSGWSAGFIDYDNDGWKDIYSANGDVDYFGDSARQSDAMFRNVGGRTVTEISAQMGPDFVRKGFHRGAAFGDLNNDGWMDIVVTGLNERPRILLNSAETSAHWLLLDLQGTVSNRDAIGARVTVTTSSGRKLHNHVAVAVGLASASDKRVHFGLGTEREIRSVEIRWPSGRLQTMGPISADRILRVEEPR